MKLRKEGIVEGGPPNIQKYLKKNKVSSVLFYTFLFYTSLFVVLKRRLFEKEEADVTILAKIEGNLPPKTGDSAPLFPLSVCSTRNIKHFAII